MEKWRTVPRVRLAEVLPLLSDLQALRSASDRAAIGKEIQHQEPPQRADGCLLQPSIQVHNRPIDAIFVIEVC